MINISSSLSVSSISAVLFISTYDKKENIARLEDELFIINEEIDKKWKQKASSRTKRVKLYLAAQIAGLVKERDCLEEVIYQTTCDTSEEKGEEVYKILEDIELSFN
jgi:Mg2+/Co2+ transporter CorB